MGIGTETGGSNVFPASVNGLYGLTLPHGSVPCEGICRISEFADRIGLMARDPYGIISLAKVLLADKSETIQDKTELKSVWQELSIGILYSEWGTDPSSEWKWGSAEIVRSSRAYHEMKSWLKLRQKNNYTSISRKMRLLGARVLFPLENPPLPSTMKHDDEGLHSVSCQCPHNFRIICIPQLLA